MVGSIDLVKTPVLDDLLIDGPEATNDGRASVAGRDAGPKIAAWRAAIGHFESYGYPSGRRGVDPIHVHEDVQICLSLNFPGRYRSGRWTRDVPAGAISVVDAWEPHAAEDPCERQVEARYCLLYVAPERWDTLAADIGAAPRAGIHVSTDAADARAFATLHRRSWDGAGALELEERLVSLLAGLLPGVNGRSVGPASSPPASPTSQARPGSARDMVDRARDYVQAHALDRLSLAEVARECGASPQHLSARFRARFGVPVHRFQTLLRLDRARGLLARGASAGEAAAACGLSDQSHLTRHFRRYLGTTPGRYARAAGRRTSGL
jgi:AraC-like DNA-binding protein